MGRERTMKFVQKFLREEDGPTAVEYAVMLALIVVVCLAAIGLLGEASRESFFGSSDAINQATGGGS
jgi:pilus assembly protein Flp/PilA